MSVVGFGLSTCGIAPAGLGSPAKNLRLVAPGYTQSLAGGVSSVMIDQRTRDYVYDAYGNETGMSDTAQRVFMCLKTVAGSRVGFQTFGLSVPKTIDSRLQSVIEQNVRLALAPVLDDGSITLDKVDATSTGTTAIAVVWWTDSRTRTSQTTRTPLEQ